MSEQAFGWIVAITDPSGVKRYYVAIKNRFEAVSAVRRRVAGAAVANVEAIAKLSERAVRVQHRLKPGDVVLVT